MRIYYLFGYSYDDIDGAKAYLEAALSCKFRMHESSYYGIYYQYGEKSGEHFVLKENVDFFDNEAAEPDFPDYKILLYLNEVAAPVDAVEKVVSRNSFSLLKVQNFE